MRATEVVSMNDQELVKEDTSSQNTVDMLLHTRLCNLLSSVSGKAELFPEKIEHGCEERLKEQLNTWLLQKVSDDGKDLKVLDQDGQGVIHVASSLGYDWAIPRVVAVGVNIDFRDVNGWTALHWAAFCGRERTVALLVVMDASLDAVTDPTPENPSGLTPYDLARANGHAGISGFLGGCCLKYLREKLSLEKETQVVPKRSSTEYLNFPDTPQNAFGEATLNAGTLDQHMRCLSLESKRLEEKCDARIGMLNEHAVVDPIIKIQDEEYRKFVWAVQIVENYALRWLRKRKGLRGFKLEDPNDFLKQGRKQALERHQKALVRVKSMVQCQGAWEQYTRLLKYFMEIGKLRRDNGWI